MLLEELNQKPFKQLPGNRQQAFAQLDKPALSPLPRHPYRYVDIKPVKVNKWGEPFCDGRADRLCCSMNNRLHDRVQRLALDQCHQGASALFADHGITLPVAQATTGINDGGTFIDRDLVGNDAGPIIAAIAFAPFLLTA